MHSAADDEDDDNDIVDVNAPNTYLMTNAVSIVRDVAAIPVNVEEPTFSEAEPLREQIVMPVEKQPTEGASAPYEMIGEVKELHIDDAQLYNELLGSYAPPGSVGDPVELNPDVAYAVEE